jgi:TatD DNase family protein
MFFDTHCHLDFKEFDYQLKQGLQNWRKADVKAFLIPATQPSSWNEIVQLSRTHQLHCAIGVHPYFLEGLQAQGFTLDSLITEITLYIERNKHLIHGIGEFGLDARQHVQHEWQEELFDIHLQQAIKHNKPAIIHSVKTHQTVVSKIKQQTRSVIGVVHGFSGSYQQAKQFIDLGLHIGVGGVITKPNAHKTRDAIRQIPLDAIVLETDSPDMKLFGETNQINTPATIPLICQHLAELRSEGLSDLEDSIYRNSVHLFGESNCN